MMNKTIFFLLFISITCSGEDSDTIANECSTQTTTQEQVECLINATAHWDSILNVNYKVLMSKIDNDEKEKLKASQRIWIIFKEKELELVNQLFAWNPKTKGTIAKIYRAQYIMEVTRQRAIVLKNYADAIDDSSK